MIDNYIRSDDKKTKTLYATQKKKRTTKIFSNFEKIDSVEIDRFQFTNNKIQFDINENKPI
jgi:hypothetical protein